MPGDPSLAYPSGLLQNLISMSPALPSTSNFMELNSHLIPLSMSQPLCANLFFEHGYFLPFPKVSFTLNRLVGVEEGDTYGGRSGNHRVPSLPSWKGTVAQRHVT